MNSYLWDLIKINLLKLIHYVCFTFFPAVGYLYIFTISYGKDVRLHKTRYKNITAVFVQSDNT